MRIPGWHSTRRAEQARRGGADRTITSRRNTLRYSAGYGIAMGKGKASARLVLADAPLWSRPALRDRPAQKGAGGGRAGAIRCPGRLERRFATARPFRDDNAHGRFPARDARLVQRRPRRWERSVAVGALAALPASPCALSRSGSVSRVSGGLKRGMGCGSAKVRRGPLTLEPRPVSRRRGRLCRFGDGGKW
jgi:hypothetical protein